MNKLANLIADGKITVEELASAEDLIKRAKLVASGIEACKKIIVFPIGVSEIECYSYIDSFGEYHSWGKCTKNGIFTCYNNWGGEHISGSCDLTNFKEVFLGFEDDEFSCDLSRFLHIQIEEAKKIK